MSRRILLKTENPIIDHTKNTFFLWKWVMRPNYFEEFLYYNFGIVVKEDTIINQPINILQLLHYISHITEESMGLHTIDIDMTPEISFATRLGLAFENQNLWQFLSLLWWCQNVDACTLDAMYKPIATPLDKPVRLIIQ